MRGHGRGGVWSLDGEQAAADVGALARRVNCRLHVAHHEALLGGQVLLRLLRAVGRVSLRMLLLVPREDVARHVLAIMRRILVRLEDPKRFAVLGQAHLVHVASPAHFVRADVVRHEEGCVLARQVMHRDVEVDAQRVVRAVHRARTKELWPVQPELRGALRREGLCVLSNHKP